jgi:D-glycerate 3-kinase
VLKVIGSKKMTADFIEKHTLPDNYNHLIDEFYQPLALRIFTKFQQNNKPLFVGINGCQGSGKSTLSAYIAQHLLSTYSLYVVVMSLDDFYLCQKERNRLADDIHPMLKKRGVPGTHDTQRLIRVISALKAKVSPISIPKFNKAADEPYTEKNWQVIDKPVDIVILEGWCWGVPAQDEAELSEPINPLEKQKDSDGVWRAYVNKQLKQYYQPLYQHFDYWVALQAPSFDYVYRWRLEQEQKLALTLNSTGKSTEPLAVMSAENILDFIQYFQRLTEHGIKTLPLFADTTFFLDKNRRIECVEEKADQK